MKTTVLKKPDAEQLRSVAGTLKDEMLTRWGIDDIVNGIQRVGLTEIGILNEVYVSPGIFATLCYYHFGDRTRKPFQVNGFTVKPWRPNTQQFLQNNRGNRKQ